MAKKKNREEAELRAKLKVETAKPRVAKSARVAELKLDAARILFRDC
jgi:hypothetical protein